jgi:hypothetical protein
MCSAITPGRSRFRACGGRVSACAVSTAGGAAACRCGRGFGASGTMGRGRTMYEMVRPRPVSRRRPADCSASFAPLDPVRDRQPGRIAGRPALQRLRFRPCRVAQGPAPPPRRQGEPFTRWLRVFTPPVTTLRPIAGASEFSLHHQLGFPLRRWFQGPSSPWRRVSPPPGGSKPLLARGPGQPFAGW